MFSHHKQAIDRVVSEYKDDPEVYAILLYGSVARGTAHAASDIDVEVFKKGGTKKHVQEVYCGVSVDLYLFSVEEIIEHVKNKPFLTYPFLEEVILFERNGFATRLIDSIEKYFENHTDLKHFWEMWTRDYLTKKKEGKPIRDVDSFYAEIEKKYSSCGPLTNDILLF
jgi:predicted nucleotidyltransferase